MKKFLLRDDEDRADNLIRWASNLEELGALMAKLGAKEFGHRDAVEGASEALGYIIEDYAGAIRETVEEAYGSILDFYSQGGARLESELKRMLLRAGNGCLSSPHDLPEIQEALEAIDAKLIECATLKDFRKEFVRLRDRIKKKP